MIKLFNDDCYKTVFDLQKNNIKIDSLITSPPYFNLRKYTDKKEEIGLENTVDKYIEKLCDLFDDIKKILNKKGSIWINLGDCYDKNGNLLCVPDRFKIEMINRGWICRNEIIWHKPNAMPSSAKNRFNNDYEKLFFFTQNKKYFFNTQYEKRISNANKSIKKEKKHKETKYDSTEFETKVRQGMNKNRGKKLIAKRNYLPNKMDFVNFIKSKSNPKFLAKETGIKETTIAHWFRKDDVGFSYPSIEDWNQVKHYFDDWSNEFYKIDKGITTVEYEYDVIDKNTDKRLKRAVWSINTKPNKVKHFASYPIELITTPIKASTDEGFTILDPFMGSGTTGIACKELNRNFIGIELSKEFFDIAKKRIGE